LRPNDFDVGQTVVARLDKVGGHALHENVVPLVVAVAVEVLLPFLVADAGLVGLLFALVVVLLPESRGVLLVCVVLLVDQREVVLHVPPVGQLVGAEAGELAGLLRLPDLGVTPRRRTTRALA